MNTAVIFDMDGVIINTEPLYTRAEIRLFREYGVEILKEDWSLFRGCAEEDFFNLSMERYNISENKSIFISSKISVGKLLEKNFMISIKDEGVGIPQRYISRITERFFRVDLEQSNKVGGTGLGLAIVKHIVTQHRGHYEILSEENQGTEIQIYLPAKT